MPRWEPLDPEFVRAIHILDALGLPYAELWRLLRPVAVRIDKPRPSYWMVRRLAIAQREEKIARREYLLDIFEDMAKGVVPRL